MSIHSVTAKSRYETSFFSRTANFVNMKAGKQITCGQYISSRVSCECHGWQWVKTFARTLLTGVDETVLHILSSTAIILHQNVFSQIWAAVSNAIGCQPRACNLHGFLVPCGERKTEIIWHSPGDKAIELNVLGETGFANSLVLRKQGQQSIKSLEKKADILPGQYQQLAGSMCSKEWTIKHYGSLESQE